MNPKEIYKLRKKQSQMQKEMEQIFSTIEKGDYRVLVRGDRKVESIEIDGDEQKDLKNIINDAMKDVNKKVEKKLRGQLSDLGIPGL
ncbi:YbaB/EbfC family nucleoid-associated protein [Patescibacteria group bacterium]